jgi:hypothetical protein
MAVVVPHKALEAISQAKDPKRAIFDGVSQKILDQFEVRGADVLLGIYIRPERTKGGIIRPTINVQEDLWQGKVALVLKWGPDAFRNVETGELYQQRFEVGRWVMHRIVDADNFHLNEWPCRLIADTKIRAGIELPDSVF